MIIYCFYYFSKKGRYKLDISSLEDWVNKSWYFRIDYVAVKKDNIDLYELTQKAIHVILG